MSFYSKLDDVQIEKYLGLISEIAEKAPEIDQAKSLVKLLQYLLEQSKVSIDVITFDELLAKSEHIEPVEFETEKFSILTLYNKFTKEQRTIYKGLVSEISKSNTDTNLARAWVKTLKDLLEQDNLIINNFTYDDLVYWFGRFPTKAYLCLGEKYKIGYRALNYHINKKFGSSLLANRYHNIIEQIALNNPVLLAKITFDDILFWDSIKQLENISTKPHAFSGCVDSKHEFDKNLYLDSFAISTLYSNFTDDQRVKYKSLVSEIFAKNSSIYFARAWVKSLQELLQDDPVAIDNLTYDDLLYWYGQATKPERDLERAKRRKKNRQKILDATLGSTWFWYVAIFGVTFILIWIASGSFTEALKVFVGLSILPILGLLAIVIILPLTIWISNDNHINHHKFK